MHLHPPRAVKKFFVRPNLQGKCESAPPQHTKCTSQPKQESIFRTVFAWWLRFGGIFRRSLRATTNPPSQTNCWLAYDMKVGSVPLPKTSMSNRLFRPLAGTGLSDLACFILYCARDQRPTGNDQRSRDLSWTYWRNTSRRQDRTCAHAHAVMGAKAFAADAEWRRHHRQVIKSTCACVWRLSSLCRSPSLSMSLRLRLRVCPAVPTELHCNRVCRSRIYDPPQPHCDNKQCTMNEAVNFFPASASWLRLLLLMMMVVFVFLFSSSVQTVLLSKFLI